MELDNSQDGKRSISNIKIDRSQLTRNQYTMSLLYEGQRVGAYYRSEGLPDTDRDYADPAAINTEAYPRGKYFRDIG
ncbi:hypothetical protein [Gracilibacillus sp. JCM 18860]|uniref:hypothetical protein n=1 Tax=Gracilibacillus sp. JCM 18860 TaxID=1306159 RepID=UPI000AEC7F59